jgi:putative redox protein
MQISIKLKRDEALRIKAEVADGRTLELNSAKEMGHAFTPMELFLFSLAGCTAMDVIWILERQRQKIEKFEVCAQGNRREDDPKYYEVIALEYKIRGDQIRKEAVERAIRLSQEKYCSVRAMIKDKVKISVTYRIITQGGEQTYSYLPSPRDH